MHARERFQCGTLFVPASPRITETIVKRILVVEDEQSIADTVVHSIEREGYAAVWCTQGLVALERIRDEDFALVVLDVGLPDVSGFELCKTVRTFSSVPIIFLTARDEEIDTIVGLEIGGDDYMTKPFSPRELGTRIKTVLRRTAHDVLPGRANSVNVCPVQGKSPGEAQGGTPSTAEKTAILRIDQEKMQAFYDGCPLELTRYEFRLLALLARHPGKVFSRETLMRNVWDDDSPSLDRTVDTHIKSLRAKCRTIRASVDPILTHRGTGYALRDDL